MNQIDEINENGFLMSNLSSEKCSPLIVFFHIPKTAGTSFRHYIYNELGKEKVFWHGEPDYGLIGNVEKDKGVSYFDRFDFIGGHFGFNNPVIKQIKRPKIFISVVREPHEQLISHFNYISKFPKHALFSEKSLEETLKAKSRFRKASTSMQCKMLTGKTEASKAIKSIISNPFLIGNLKHMDIFIEKLRLLFGFEGEQLRKSNTGSKDYKSQYSHIDKELIQSIISEDEKIVNYVGNIYCNISL